MASIELDPASWTPLLIAPRQKRSADDAAVLSFLHPPPTDDTRNPFTVSQTTSPPSLFEQQERRVARLPSFNTAPPQPDLPKPTHAFVFNPPQDFLEREIELHRAEASVLRWTFEYNPPSPTVQLSPLSPDEQLRDSDDSDIDDGSVHDTRPLIPSTGNVFDSELCFATNINSLATKTTVAAVAGNELAQVVPVDSCAVCEATETCEWRKGPSGPRLLCNACGLMYAKRLRERSLKGKFEFA
ncbi:hypothetical protein ACM66B_000643 [Microbotryomycetes sp. NB124-2]